MKHRQRQYMIMLIMLLSLSACRTPIEAPPKEVVIRSISGLAGEDHFTFKGMTEIRTGEREVLTKSLRYEGQVKHHQGMYMRLVSSEQKESTTTTRWNPLKLLEEIGKSRISVERVEPTKDMYAMNAANGASKEERGVTAPTFPLDQASAFRIQVDPRDAKQMFEARIWREYDQVVLPRQQMLSVREKLSNEEVAQLEQQLRKTTQSHRANLKSLLKTSNVEAEYLLWIDQKSQLPLRLDGKMKVYYNHKGNASETIRTVSEFVRTR